MSLAMRAGNMGDPGLFGFLGNAIKGTVGGFLTGGPAGAILGGAAATVGALGGPKTVSQAKAANVLQVATRGAPYPVPGIRGGMFGGTVPARPALQAGSGVYVGPGGAAVGKYNMQGSGAPAPAAAAAGTAKCGLAGYHLNKTTYATHDGWVAKGSKCVRNRRRNPLNPRALSRAMSRVASAQRAVRCLSLFAGPAAKASHSAKSTGRFGRNGKKACRCK